MGVSLAASLIALICAIGIAYAAGVNLYATIASLGLTWSLGGVNAAQGTLSVCANPWVIGIALGLYVVEVVTTFVPGVASAWETVHSLIRPPAAAILAAASVWHGNPWFVLIAAFCGGAIAVATHTTKLGVRYILETAATRRLTLVADLGEGVFVLLLIVMMQKWPAATVLIALGVLCAVLLLVRLIWRTLLQVFTGRWTPACGLLQAPRLGTHERELSDEYID